MSFGFDGFFVVLRSSYKLSSERYLVFSFLMDSFLGFSFTRIKAGKSSKAREEGRYLTLSRES